jgi:DNA-binding GntR family transcriptional regulator
MTSRPPTLYPIEHVSISDRAYGILRESILRRTFAPGEQLNLERLELQLGISRTPLKEAITRLALEGLIKVTPRRGTYVTELHIEDVAERFDMRRFLEVGAAEQALHCMSPEGLEKLHALAAGLESMVLPDGDCDDYEDYIEGDREFHATFIGFVGNRMLSETYDHLNVHLYVVRVYYAGTNKKLDRVNKEHNELLAHIATRDVPGVIQSINKHLEKSKQDILGRMRATT